MWHRPGCVYLEQNLPLLASVGLQVRPALGQRGQHQDQLRMVFAGYQARPGGQETQARQLLIDASEMGASQMVLT